MPFFKKKPKPQADAAISAVPPADDDAQDSIEIPDDSKHKTIAEEFEEQKSSPAGLTSDEAQVRNSPFRTLFPFEMTSQTTF